MKANRPKKPKTARPAVPIASRLRSIGLGALVGGATAALAWGAYWGLGRAARSEYFAVDRIEVRAGARYATEEVLARVEARRGDSLLLLDSDALARQLTALPWVKEASVRKRFPGVLEIRLAEREPAALAALEELWWVGDEGELIAPARGERRLDYPVLTGALDRDLGRANPFAAEVAAAREAGGTKFGPDVEEIHVDARGGMEFVLAGSAMRVRVGAAARPGQFDRLARVLADLERRGERALRVDLDHREAAVVTLAGAAAGNRDSALRSARTAGADGAAERRG